MKRFVSVLYPHRTEVSGKKLREKVEVLACKKGTYGVQVADGIFVLSEGDRMETEDLVCDARMAYVRSGKYLAFHSAREVQDRSGGYGVQVETGAPIDGELEVKGNKVVGRILSYGGQEVVIRLPRSVRSLVVDGVDRKKGVEGRICRIPVLGETRFVIS